MASPQGENTRGAKNTRAKDKPELLHNCGDVQPDRSLAGLQSNISTLPLSQAKVEVATGVNHCRKSIVSGRNSPQG